MFEESRNETGCHKYDACVCGAHRCCHKGKCGVLFLSANERNLQNSCFGCPQWPEDRDERGAATTIDKVSADRPSAEIPILSLHWCQHHKVKHLMMVDQRQASGQWRLTNHRQLLARTQRVFAVFGPNLCRFGRGPPNLAPAATSELGAQTSDLGKPCVHAKNG